MSIYVTIYIVYNLFIKRYEEVEERLEGKKKKKRVRYRYCASIGMKDI